jgi:DNA repair protein RecO (recombination protein O)
MEWTDEGIVLGVRKHGEANAILELLTQQHGRHHGLVRGGAGSRMRAVLQPGNTLRASWRARLDEHLGHYSVEGLQLRVGDFLSASHAVYAVTHLAALVRLLPERDPHGDVYAALATLLGTISEPALTAANMVQFELQMLRELGFGLDLTSCAATGATADLDFVSPKSGRAVSHAAGEAWRERLLPLPAFLRDGLVTDPPQLSDLGAGFALTGFFLTRQVLEPRGLALSDARAYFIAAVARAAATAA